MTKNEKSKSLKIKMAKNKTIHNLGYRTLIRSSKPKDKSKTKQADIRLILSFFFNLPFHFSTRHNHLNSKIISMEGLVKAKDSQPRGPIFDHFGHRLL